MRAGVIILCIFAGVWAIAGIVVQGLAPAWSVVPLAVSAGVLAWAVRQPPGPQPGPHVRRLVNIWSGIEGVAMAITGNYLVQHHLNAAIMPALVIIVGLHFVPLARGIPVRFYYGTGAALVLLGLFGLLTPLPALLIGVTAAMMLWASAIALAKGVR